MVRGPSVPREKDGDHGRLSRLCFLQLWRETTARAQRPQHQAGCTFPGTAGVFLSLAVLGSVSPSPEGRASGLRDRVSCLQGWRWEMGWG